LEGRLVSTGERYVDNVSVISLDRLRELSREKRVEGYRVPVRYLPKQRGFWAGQPLQTVSRADARGFRSRIPRRVGRR
jgi:hypothetical protein